MATFKYGILGCGMMGGEHIQNIHLLPDTAISVIFEPDAGMAKRATELAPEATFVDSIDALLAQNGHARPPLGRPDAANRAGPRDVRRPGDPCAG